MKRFVGLLLVLTLCAIGASQPDPQLVLYPVFSPCNGQPGCPTYWGYDINVHSDDPTVTAFLVTVWIKDPQGHEASFDQRAVIVRNGWAYGRYTWADISQFPLSRVEMVALREAFRRTEVR